MTSSQRSLQVQKGFSYLFNNKFYLHRQIAVLIKREIPETFAVQEVIESSLGDMPVEKKKGDGGHSTLERRIGDSFQNKFLRLVKADYGFST